MHISKIWSPCKLWKLYKILNFLFSFSSSFFLKGSFQNKSKGIFHQQLRSSYSFSSSEAFFFFFLSSFVTHLAKDFEHIHYFTRKLIHIFTMLTSPSLRIKLITEICRWIVHFFVCLWQWKLVKYWKGGLLSPFYLW